MCANCHFARQSAHFVRTDRDLMELSASLKLVLGQKELVIRQFYDRFLEECAAARPLFEGVDLERQALMLTTALIVVEAHAREQLPALNHYLHVLGDRHRNAGVPRELFPEFRECLIRTIRDCHGDGWSDAIEEAWRAALNLTIDTMFDGYEKDYPI